MRRLLISLLLILNLVATPLPAQAEDTVLPKTNKKEEEALPNDAKTFCANVAKAKAGDHLVEKIQCGAMSFGDLPYYFLAFLKLLMQLSTVVSTIMIMIGGYMWTVKDLTGDKSKALNIIKYSLIGLVISSAAWVIVNVVQGLVLGL